MNSHPQMEAYFRELGLLESFVDGKGFSFDDRHLESAEDRHPAIIKVRALRKVLRLQADKLLTGELIGSDGRLHPDHRQLGAESSRNSMRWPNIGGIGKALRPLVVPDDPAAFAIGEVDLSQIEVGIAAAVYGDEDLVRKFNTGDVYTQMARDFFRAELPAASLLLDDRGFKRKHRPMRDQMKLYTLAVIYNITAAGLAAQLGINQGLAEQKRNQFLRMFPDLVTAIDVGAGENVYHFAGRMRPSEVVVG